MLSHINSLSDVAAFTRQLIGEGVNVHPDTDFNDYVNMETGLRTFTVSEAELLNKLMSECFDLCAADGIDIYDFIQEIYLTETGLYKFIPLPSQLNK